ncbi:MAG: gamma carbonic anhydrase family protein [Alphaproteobacteria bacterium]
MTEPFQTRGAHILPFKGKFPTMGAGVFVAAGASVIGDVTLGVNVNIWFNAVLRGDVHFITVGDNTNIQDGAVCHVTTGKHPLVIGAGVTVGHSAILHGCTVEDTALIGMGAVVLDGAVVQRGAMVAAGAVVTPRTVVPAGELWAGNPAKKLRDVKPDEAAYLLWSAPHYTQLAATYLAEAQAAAPESLQHLS